MLKGTAIETGYYRILETRIVPKLIDWKLTPNHITLAGLLISMLAGVSFVYFPLAGRVVHASDRSSGYPGRFAGKGDGQSKKFGAFLDSVLDRYTEFMIYLGIWFYFYRNNARTPYSLLILLILFGSLMVSYTRARAEGLGERCLVGVFQRGERIILLGAAGILNPFINLFGCRFRDRLGNGLGSERRACRPCLRHQPDRHVALPACLEQSQEKNLNRIRTGIQEKRKAARLTSDGVEGLLQDYHVVFPVNFKGIPTSNPSISIKSALLRVMLPLWPIVRKLPVLITTVGLDTGGLSRSRLRNRVLS